MTLQALNTILLACTMHLNPQTAHHRQQALNLERSCRATIIMCVDNIELERQKHCGEGTSIECFASKDDDVVGCITRRIIHGS